MRWCEGRCVEWQLWRRRWWLTGSYHSNVFDDLSNLFFTAKADADADGQAGGHEHSHAAGSGCSALQMPVAV